MIAIVTDKPNVGREIARVLGADRKENGYMSGNGYMVTWTYGNMLSLAMPKDTGTACKDGHGMESRHQCGAPVEGDSRGVRCV